MWLMIYLPGWACVMQWYYMLRVLDLNFDRSQLHAYDSLISTWVYCKGYIQNVCMSNYHSFEHTFQPLLLFLLVCVHVKVINYNQLHSYIYLPIPTKITSYHDLRLESKSKAWEIITYCQIDNMSTSKIDFVVAFNRHAYWPHSAA